MTRKSNFPNLGGLKPQYHLIWLYLISVEAGGRNFRCQGLAMYPGYRQLEATLKQPHGPIHSRYMHRNRSKGSICNPLAPFLLGHRAIPAIGSLYTVQHLGDPTEEALLYFGVGMRTIRILGPPFPLP